MEKSSPFLQQRQGCGAGINPALRRFCRQFNLNFSSSGFTHVTPSCTNGVYSPGTPQVTLPNPLPTFCPLTHHPSFPLWNEFCLWFCGASLSLLSSRPLDQPVHPSSHSKLLWATPGTGTSQCSLFPLPAGSASCFSQSLLSQTSVILTKQNSSLFRRQNKGSACPGELPDVASHLPLILP